MVYSIDYTDALDDQLNALQTSAPKDFALWKQLVDLLWDNQQMRYELSVNRTAQPGPPRFDTQPVGNLLKSGYSVWRLKLLREDRVTQLSQFRLLYAFHHNVNPPVLHLLALMPRIENYAPAQPTVKRCLRDYAAIGVPRIT